MAHLTKPTVYDIKDSNIELLGSDLEKRVREHSGSAESAWKDAGTSEGIQIWRIEKFDVVNWPSARAGEFYEGDSYIVLRTYKKTPEAEAFSFDLHFWLGEDTTEDEAGTAAYKTVELDDHLHGAPVQYREVQGYESDHFLSYFRRFVCLKGGVASGFHHVTDKPALDIRNLYRITFTKNAARTSLVIRQVPAEASSLVAGDAYVLDKGTQLLQYNTKTSAGQEKFKAAEFVQSILQSRQGQCTLTVYDEGTSGSSLFLMEFGENVSLVLQEKEQSAHSLFRLSDSSGSVTFEEVESVSQSSLVSSDAFIFDAGKIVFVWLGKGSSLTEKRLAPQYAQKYLYNKHEKDEHAKVSIPVVKVVEGNEPKEFFDALGA